MASYQPSLFLRSVQIPNGIIASVMQVSRRSNSLKSSGKHVPTRLIPVTSIFALFFPLSIIYLVKSMVSRYFSGGE